MTAFSTVAVVAAWVVGTCWGVFLSLRHLDADATDLDPRLGPLSEFVEDHGAAFPIPTGATAGRTLDRLRSDPRAVVGAWLPFVGVTLWALPGWVAVGALLLAAPPWLAHIEIVTERRGSA